MNNGELVNQLKKDKLIVVTAINDTSKVEPLVDSLLKTGVRWLELIFRNEKTEECLKILQKMNKPIHYGAGTVRTLEQAKQAKSAGAEFLVSPGFNGEIVKWAQQEDILFIPGVDSTIAIEEAQKHGLKILKFFPAVVSGGPKWLKAIKGPYYDISFIPTGGVNIENFNEFLALPNVMAAAGSFLAKASLIDAGKFDEIEKVCKRAVNLIRE